MILTVKKILKICWIFPQLKEINKKESLIYKLKYLKVIIILNKAPSNFLSTHKILYKQNLIHLNHNLNFLDLLLKINQNIFLITMILLMKIYKKIINNQLIILVLLKAIVQEDF